MLNKTITIFFLIFSLSSCFDEPNTGAKKVTWDRDICERCRMVLSSPYFAAQVRYTPKGKNKSRVAEFDDIGCAIIWLKDKEFKDADSTEIWVSDHKNKKWINAKTATFVHKKTSPMEYGLGAQNEFVKGGLNYEQAKKHVFEIENKFNIHSAHPLVRDTTQQQTNTKEAK